MPRPLRVCPPGDQDDEQPSSATGQECINLHRLLAQAVGQLGTMIATRRVTRRGLRFVASRVRTCVPRIEALANTPSDDAVGETVHEEAY